MEKARSHRLRMLADDKHPNDYGMQEIAEAVIQCLEQAGW